MAGESEMSRHEIEVEQAESDAELHETDYVQFEALHGSNTTFGEGYEAALRQISDEISRQIKELDKRWVAKWAPQDLALKNHERRIKALENRRPR